MEGRDEGNHRPSSENEAESFLRRGPETSTCMQLLIAICQWDTVFLVEVFRSLNGEEEEVKEGIKSYDEFAAGLMHMRLVHFNSQN